MNILCIGAHPDDCEGSVGGTALLHRERGHSVTFVSVTDGSRGHFLASYLENPRALIDRRRQESIAAAAVGDLQFESLDMVDGEVAVDQQGTERMIRLIRRHRADLVLMNRDNDYHRDHRNTARLILDASYLLTVPLLCPDTPALRTMPVFAYWQDRFTEGGAFRPDVVVSIDEVINRKVQMMLAHESQYSEWLAYSAERGSLLDNLPTDPRERRSALFERLKSRSLDERGGYSESFQISEYGRRPTVAEIAALFPNPRPRD